MYKLGMISKEGWIPILGEDSSDSAGEFIEFVKMYQSTTLGNIKKHTEDMQYIIDNDQFKLIFQWDSCFGNIVIIPDNVDISIVTQKLQKICDRLNQKKAN